MKNPRTMAAALVAVLMILPAIGSGSSAAAVPRSAGAAPAAVVAVSSQLRGQACPSLTSCFAVGFYSVTSSGPDKTLVERWNGTSWSVVASPNPAGAKFSRLLGVACQSTTSCFAVGQQSSSSPQVTKPLVERWNGASWSIVASASATGNGQLNGVSCTGTSCLAVGEQLINSSTCCKTLVERWNGSAWLFVASPTVPGSSASRLNAVSCNTTLVCVAVGGSVDTSPLSKTLVERWNGTGMSVVPSPNPDVGEGGTLTSVSCPSPATCVAAGFNNLGGVGKPTTLIERWNGTTWTIQANPNPALSYSEFRGISCPTVAYCIAVGDSQSPGNFVGSKTLVERWNGTAWNIPASPNAGSFNSLAAVKCINNTRCFAAGHGSAGSGANTALIERWTWGTSWTVAVSGNP